MNRLATQPITFNPPPVSSKSSISLPLDNLSGSEVHVEAPRAIETRPAVFCPLHYEPGYAYPLIVWLHDAGESEQVLRRVVPRISLRNYVAVAPRGTEALKRSSCNEEAFSWLHDADHVEQAEERVLDAIEFVRGSLNVSPERVFMAGKGEGGTMALRMAFEHPQHFAGAISLDGFLPRQGLPLRRVNDLRRLPVLLSVRVTASLDCQRFRDDESLLHAAGIPYTRATYSGEDAASLQMLVDLDRWIMAQVCPPDTQRNVD
jgi:phospholipase/carboxylesterase